jgi:hypothetical protein
MGADRAPLPGDGRPYPHFAIVRVRNASYLQGFAVRAQTLAAVHVYLDGVFTYGQAYTALSRAASLQGLFVEPKGLRAWAANTRAKLNMHGGIPKDEFNVHPRVLDAFPKPVVL